MTSKAWPYNLPAPILQRSHDILSRSQQVQMDSGRVRNRRIHLNPLEILSATWHFTEDQFASFESFFYSDLRNGEHPFELITRNPTNGLHLIREVASLTGNYTFRRNDNLFVVFAELLEEKKVSGRCLLLDGSSSYVEVLETTAAMLDRSGGEELTIEAWLKPNTVSGLDTFITKGRTTVALKANYELRLNAGRLNFYYRNATDNGSHQYLADAGTELTMGQWTQVAFVYQFANAASAAFYVNGQSIPGSWSSGDGTEAPWVDDQPMWIGRHLGNDGVTPNDYFDGRIDELRLWSVIRTSAELAANYNRVLNGTEPDLSAYWRFDEVDETGGVTAYDRTVNGNDGTLKGGADWDDSPPNLYSPPIRSI